MKMTVIKQPKQKALQIHKDFLQFLKVNLLFVLIAFALYSIGNVSEYVTFNSKDFINIQNVNEGVIATPSISLQTWFFFILYWLSFYITPTLMLWFHRNNNPVSNGKMFKAKKINISIIKSFFLTLINFRIYVLVLLASFFVLLIISFILKTFPEIKDGIDLFVNFYSQAKSANAIEQNNPFLSPEFVEYSQKISEISYFRITLGFFEVILTCFVLQVVYFVSIPLVAVHKEIGVFKSLFLSFKAVIVNWHIFLSVSILLMIVAIGFKLVDDVFVISRFFVILLSVIILPYVILLQKNLFKKID